MFEKIRAAITDDNEISKEWQRFASLAFLLFAFLLSLMSYDRKGLLNTFRSDVSIHPDLLSGALALALIAPLYLRGILKWNKSPFTTISFVLILGVFASFLEMSILGRNSFIKDFNLYMVMIALALSWVGVRGIAGIAWIIVLLVGIHSLTVVANAMSFGGFLYIASATLGLCFHSGVNPGDLLGNLKDEYSPKATQMKKRISDDVSAAGQLYRP